LAPLNTYILIKKGKKKYFKKVLKNRKLEKNAIRDEIDKKN
jgi:hypothetical protein